MNPANAPFVETRREMVDVADTDFIDVSAVLLAIERDAPLRRVLPAMSPP